MGKKYPEVRINNKKVYSHKIKNLLYLSNVKHWYKGILVVRLMLLKILPVSKIPKENQFS